MTDRPAPLRPPAGSTKTDRATRSAAALRANLARRKARKRARDAEPAAPTPSR